MTTEKHAQALPGRHGGHRHSHSGTRRMVRFGMMATAALGAVGAAAGVAQAVTIGNGFTSDSGGVAIADNETFALSNAHDPSTFKDSFTIRQFGDVIGANVRNEATAESAGCSADSPCRAVSLSFQIVTMAGENIHLDATNLGNAANEHCAGCQTVAGAYQFVVSTPGAFTLSSSAEAQLATIHQELNALSNSSLSTTEVQAKADALAVQVAAILKNAAATSPQGPVAHPPAASGFSPSVKVFRDFQQH